jgi:hypothetical protein
MPFRTALSPRLLIRMRSQVQVLAGPPPNPAGHSVAVSEPGALAAGLGRAGAARPSPPAHPLGPPGPPTRASGSATTTHRGRAPQPRTPATRRMPPPRAAACSRAHRPAARDGRSPTPAWPAWSLSGQARPPRPAPNPAARVHHRPPTDQPDCGSVARVPASWSVGRAVDGPPATGGSRSGGQGRPATATWSPTPPPQHGEEMDASEWTGADTRRPGTARVDSRRLDTGRVDSRRPTAGPSGRRPR